MTSRADLSDAMRRHGFAFVQGGQMRGMLASADPAGPTAAADLGDWTAFAASWDELHLDPYMAEGSRYRRRRHARFAAAGAQVQRRPHGPHWQSVDYNPLHGGIERWFEPITDEVGESATLGTILGWCHGWFGALAPDTAAWDVEVHQFRIEARADAPGNPTPEGVHRDGVDYVLVLLIQRRNIASGTTTIHAADDGRELGSFTLAAPLDAALVDDERVHHGVTPVEPVAPGAKAFRDVLVVTFRRSVST